MAAPVVGLTGGIGSGKSTVAAILAELGARVIDADRIGHEVYGPGTEGHASVVQAFGPRVVAPDGTIDRRALGAIVFHDPGALARLNAIVHPLIAAEIQRRVAAARAEPGAPPIVIEAAILIEAGWRFFDRIWAVIAPREAAFDRVVADRGLSREDIERRMAAQATDEDRRRVAHLVIENDGTRGELRLRVEAAWRTLGR
ncbi:MAG: dephospho-CoA kinase [Deltaproteobacteria bacterium]|nr:MAG: dephospho-CoA kinase [Deltaproteobacteria bacterium]